MARRTTQPQVSCLRANTEPLHLRLPKTDGQGRFPGDFMMLIPGLRELSAAQTETRLAQLQGILDADDDVIFADLNLPLNLLWVSVRQRHGVVTAVASMIREHFPAARLVGHTTLEKKPAARPASLRTRLALWARRVGRPLLPR
ncbi:MAG: hypothetical protein QNJ85_15230 [Gammaproteobacteria bacterium]|nr:hypothetical protein [Gammaproteobacteria bacterium]